MLYCTRRVVASTRTSTSTRNPYSMLPLAYRGDALAWPAVDPSFLSKINKSRFFPGSCWIHATSFGLFLPGRAGRRSLHFADGFGCLSAGWCHLTGAPAAWAMDWLDPESTWMLMWNIQAVVRLGM